jgi:hypothetical protein
MPGGQRYSLGAPKAYLDKIAKKFGTGPTPTKRGREEVGVKACMQVLSRRLLQICG